MIKILADENIHRTIIENLVSSHINVKAVAKSAYEGSPDTKLIEIAAKEKRIIITADKDFGELLELRYKEEGLGVILLRYNLLNPQRISNDILTALGYISQSKFKDHGFIVVLSEGRVRLRAKE